MTARAYAEARLLQSMESVEHEVVILRGGFTDFQEIFKVTFSHILATAHRANTFRKKDDPELVENWDHRAWSLKSLNVW